MRETRNAALRIASRIVAVWLVVLIAAPFTAPFRTLDLAALETGVQSHDSLSGEKLVAGDAATDPFFLAASFTLESFPLRRQPFHVAVQTAQRAVLRL